MKEFVVEKSILQKNFHAVRQRAGGARILAVLKSNAYGLGLLPMARFCREMGVTAFGITEPGDAALLREQGYHQEDILMLRSTAVPSEIEQILDNNVIASVGSQEAALALSGLAEKRSAIAEVHIKIDSGLGRYGFLPSEFDKIRSVYEYMTAIAVSGVYTHLPPYLPPKKAERSMAAFEGVLGKLRETKLETGTVHALGSTALFRYKNPPLYDMVRIGAALGGRVKGTKTGLSPAGVIIAPVADIRWMPPGSMVAERCRVSKPMRIGIVPVGTTDGFMAGRCGGGASLLGLLTKRVAVVHSVRKTEALPVIGKVGQNHFVVNLTQSDCNIGDLVSVAVDPLFALGGTREYR